MAKQKDLRQLKEVKHDMEIIKLVVRNSAVVITVVKAVEQDNRNFA